MGLKYYLSATKIHRNFRTEISEIVLSGICHIRNIGNRCGHAVLTINLVVAVTMTIAQHDVFSQICSGNHIKLFMDSRVVEIEEHFFFCITSLVRCFISFVECHYHLGQSVGFGRGELGISGIARPSGSLKSSASGRQAEIRGTSSGEFNFGDGLACGSHDAYDVVRVRADLWARPVTRGIIFVLRLFEHDKDVVFRKIVQIAWIAL